MTTTMESMATRAAQTRRPAIETPRLQLKPAHQTCGFVQGAWWPRSTQLAAELPPLLAALSSRFGAIERVQYNECDWSPTSQHVQPPGRAVLMDSSNDTPNVISVFGLQFGKLTLLVVPPYTEATHAYTVVTTASSALDSSTPDQLLGIDDDSAVERPLTPIVLHRWESDGGSLCPTTRPQLGGPAVKSAAH